MIGLLANGTRKKKMAATKERFQNPVCGDTVILRLFVFNSNNLANVDSITKVEIFFLDPAEVSDTNKDGRRLIQEFTTVQQDDVGKYFIEITASSPEYTIGKYIDVWHLEFIGEDCPATVQNNFQLYPQLWYTSPVPVVHDFSFTFRPNRIRSGEKRYIIIEITPNVPRATDLARYYENLAIVSDLKISMEMNCGDCVPQEQDLRLIFDKESVTMREKRLGYFQIDTADMDCGIYNVWFQLELGGNVYISDKQQLQIFA